VQLGPFSLSLAVADLDASVAFYALLGFEVIDGGHTSSGFPDTIDQMWRIVANGDTKIGLFQGMLPKNMLTFNPPDVRAVQRILKEAGVTLISEADEGTGPADVMVEDPDGNPILLDQF
jgi:catechol 2,3-dioxygenase-like lactoylglutathione lyase family enzyme